MSDHGPCNCEQVVELVQLVKELRAELYTVEKPLPDLVDLILKASEAIAFAENTDPDNEAGRRP